MPSQVKHDITNRMTCINIMHILLCAMLRVLQDIHKSSKSDYYTFHMTKVNGVLVYDFSHLQLAYGVPLNYHGKNEKVT